MLEAQRYKGDQGKRSRLKKSCQLHAGRAGELERPILAEENRSSLVHHLRRGHGSWDSLGWRQRCIAVWTESLSQSIVLDVFVDASCHIREAQKRSSGSSC